MLHCTMKDTSCCQQCRLPSPESASLFEVLARRVRAYRNLVYVQCGTAKSLIYKAPKRCVNAVAPSGRGFARRPLLTSPSDLGPARDPHPKRKSGTPDLQWGRSARSLLRAGWGRNHDAPKPVPKPVAVTRRGQPARTRAGAHALEALTGHGQGPLLDQRADSGFILRFALLQPHGRRRACCPS